MLTSRSGCKGALTHREGGFPPPNTHLRQDAAGRNATRGVIHLSHGAIPGLMARAPATARAKGAGPPRGPWCQKQRSPGAALGHTNGTEGDEAADWPPVRCAAPPEGQRLQGAMRPVRQKTLPMPKAWNSSVR